MEQIEIPYEHWILIYCPREIIEFDVRIISRPTSNGLANHQPPAMLICFARILPVSNTICQSTTCQASELDS